MTSPLPPIQQDPAYTAAKAAAADYLAAASATRSNFQASDLLKAEQIAAFWEAANSTIVTAWTDLNTRRQARLDYLETLVPVGPNVPANSTPADSAVLHQSFRSALDRARAAAGDATSLGGLAAMLADALKFGDDMLLRATLTAAVDAGMPGIVEEYCAQRGLTDELTELIALRSTLAGYPDLETRLFQATFQAIPRPEESYNLPALRAAAQQAITEANRTPSRGWN
jgi:hypothetical protein